MRGFRRNLGVDVKGWKQGMPLLYQEAIVCANRDCAQLTLLIWLMTTSGMNSRGVWDDILPIQRFPLQPPSSAKPQPEFIPKPLRDDYTEACRIRDLSPKASATLARRCLQGMIRDFCRITRYTLDQEIKALRTSIDEGTEPRGVTPESVDGIDAVRKIGNIGAHMEADVSLIVDIDPGEAQLLIELIETLFDEWYVAQDRRQKRFASVVALAEEKRAELEQLKIAAQEQKKLPPPNAKS
jgi:Domain of unknown function (DUF4145)